MLKPMLKRSLHLLISLFILITIDIGVKTTSVSSVNETSTVLYFPIIAHEGLTLPETAAWIGPGGGAITDLIFDPVNPNVVMAAAYGGGIYKSTDSGLSWVDVSLGLGNLQVTTVEISTKNPLIMYAGTYQGGIYKSVDYGEFWYRSDAGFQAGAIPYAIEIDPTRSKRIYISTRGISNNGAAPWNGVVYKSEDGGSTWSGVLTDVGGSSQEDWAYDLAIHPSSTNVVYAATHEHGAYRSLDYGGTWQAINNGVTDFTGRAIEPNPSSPYPGVVYLGVFHRTGIFKSFNGGDLWTLLDNNISEARIYKLSIDQDDPNTIYLATFDDGVMKSTNGGTNWSHAGLGDETILDVVIKPGAGQVLLGGTLDNGLFRSTNGGGSWYHSQDGLNASTITEIVVDPGDSQVLYASLEPGWIARSTNGGESWSDYHTNIDDKVVNGLVLHPTQSQLLYALTEDAGLYRRDTQSGGWQSIGQNLPTIFWPRPMNTDSSEDRLDIMEDLFPDIQISTNETASTVAVTPLLSLVFAPTDPIRAYLGTDGAGVYQSLDSGLSWSSSGLSGLAVRDLVVSQDDPSKIYAATNGTGSVWRSTNGGSNWTNLNLPTGTAYAFVIPDSSPEVLYVGTSEGVFKYIGYWLSSGLAGLSVRAIAVHPNNSNILFAGTMAGVYVSMDGGLSWGPGPPELDGIWIESIRFDPNDFNMIYFATRAHGVLRLSP
jgi:photosystem II stability/assembly factor-like uncharacterized protein